jgi:hypothetical protein
LAVTLPEKIPLPVTSRAAEGFVPIPSCRPERSPKRKGMFVSVEYTVSEFACLGPEYAVVFPRKIVFEFEFPRPALEPIAITFELLFKNAAPIPRPITVDPELFWPAVAPINMFESPELLFPAFEPIAIRLAPVLEVAADVPSATRKAPELLSAAVGPSATILVPHRFTIPEPKRIFELVELITIGVELMFDRPVIADKLAVVPEKAPDTFRLDSMLAAEIVASPLTLSVPPAPSVVVE